MNIIEEMIIILDMSYFFIRGGEGSVSKINTKKHPVFKLSVDTYTQSREKAQRTKLIE
jgi:hypothetical protein